MKKEQIKKFEKLPFEDALEKLELIVSSMEDGDLPLEEMSKRFEEGNALSIICRKKLNELEKKVEILVRQNTDGEHWRDFDEDESRKSSRPNTDKKAVSEDLLF